ncbi:hypothetical protein MCEMSHM24_02433 [Comamonadaceae bacterium]
MKSIAIAILMSVLGASASASTCNQGIDVSQMSLAELREDKAEKLSAPPKYSFLLSSNGKRVRSADGTPILSPAYPGIECEVPDEENAHSQKME